MKYLLLAYGDRKRREALSKAEFEALVAECRVHDEELRKTGRVLSVESLEWETTTLRPRSGKTVITDGPFAEAKEQVGSILVIEAEDLSDAVRVAALHPAAHLGEHLGWWVEVRPIADGCHQ
ncbi:MAG: YciI family protein [Thermodesulfobacteriota bacterium]